MEIHCSGCGAHLHYASASPYHGHRHIYEPRVPPLSGHRHIFVPLISVDVAVCLHSLFTEVAVFSFICAFTGIHNFMHMSPFFKCGLPCSLASWFKVQNRKSRECT